MIDMNKRNIFFIMACLAVISFTALPLLVNASPKELEEMNDAATVQMLPDKQPDKKKQHTDPFTMAIIGLSFGCMMVASSVHWNLHTRKEIESQISNLGFLLDSTCSVECHINGCTDTDPMMGAVEEIKKKRDESIKKYEFDKNDAQRSVAEIENEIMRIWG